MNPTSVVPALALALAAAVLTPRPAAAFCGFYVSGSGAGLYNKATRVALMRQGTRTVLSMSNDYEGPPEDFALVIPVPVAVSQENVRTLPRDVFDHLESLTAPRLVEYWEQDPCGMGQGGPGEAMGFQTATLTSLRLSDESVSDHGVRVEARFTVGEYQIVVLSASDSSGLETWLRERQYRIPEGAAAWLAPYVRGGWRFFVARVDIARAQRLPGGGARLSPLRMQYDSTEFRLPVRLGLLNAPPGAQDLIVYVLHSSNRFETANYRNVFVPTNLDVAEGVRGQFPAFYASLFDATMESAGKRAVVTEYAWSTGTCDPCPTPPLDATDLATLGADAMDDLPSPTRMVVTRLHTRYNAATLTDDLVFREALPVVGGRENPTDSHLPLAHGAVPTAQGNNFQARYVIRHAWDGPVACEHPRRGVWGGDPRPGTGTGTALPQPVLARELASAAHDAVDLPAMVLSPVSGVDLRARLVLPPPPAPGAVVHPATIPAAGIHHGCACDVPGARGAPRAWRGIGGLLLAAAVGFRYRRAPVTVRRGRTGTGPPPRPPATSRR